MSGCTGWLTTARSPSHFRLSTRRDWPARMCAVLRAGASRIRLASRRQRAATASEGVRSRICFSSSSRRTSRRSRTISACSSRVVPGRDPSSISAWRTHLRNVSACTPSRRAVSAIDNSPSRKSRIASSRNSGGYFDGRPICWSSPLTSPPTIKASTESGQAQAHSPAARRSTAATAAESSTHDARSARQPPCRNASNRRPEGSREHSRGTRLELRTTYQPLMFVKASPTPVDEPPTRCSPPSLPQTGRRRRDGGSSAAREVGRLGISGRAAPRRRPSPVLDSSDLSG